MPENNAIPAVAASVSSNGFPGGETPYTPGPWKVDDGEIQSEEGALIGIIYSTESFPCVDEDDPNYDKIVAEMRTNARLVANSPKSFELVKAYRDALLNGPENLSLAEAERLEALADALIAEVERGEPGNQGLGGTNPSA